MATLSQKSFDNLSEKSRKDYCQNCWARGYGDCKKCAIEINRQRAKGKIQQ